MGIISRLGEKLRAAGGRKPAEEVRVDSLKGRVTLSAADIRVRMELFKLFPGRRAWGFEIVVENVYGKELHDVLIWFTSSKHATLDRLPEGKMAIKTVELSMDEAPLADMAVRIERAHAQGRLTSHFTVPLQKVMREFREAGRIDVIEEEPARRRVSEPVPTWRSRPPVTAAKPAVETAVPDPLQRLREINREKADLTANFMKRKVDYAAYSQLMNSLQKEELDIKARIDSRK
ncbi:MAG: hypothetical protein V1787_03295 [Candidatus Micrarchaeota archaeon]